MMLNAKILVVDDDLTFCRLMERFLAHEGAVASTAGSGREALRLFVAEQPDLVMLDVRIPDVDGFEICRRLREQSTVPIIMLSAADGSDYVIKGLECGADDFIAKPVPFVVLRARIDAARRRARTPGAASR